jgi:hypothetical protein
MRIRRHVFPFVAFFAMLTIAASLSQNFIREGCNFWTTSVSEFTNGWGHIGRFDDSEAYVIYAQNLPEYFHWLLGDSQELPVKSTIPLGIIFGKWAPGFPVTIATIIKLTGSGNYFVKMLLLALLLWAFALTFLWEIVFDSQWKYIPLIGMLFLLPDLRNWTVGVGYVMSESITNAFFVLGCTVLIRARNESKKQYALLSAVVFAIAANYRQLNETQVTLAGIIALSFLASAYILGRRGRESSASIKTLVTGLGLIFVISSPWKTLNYQIYNEFSLSPATSALHSRYFWLPDRYVPDWGITLNLPCKLDNKRCNDINERPTAYTKNMLAMLAVKTLISHPLALARAKLRSFDWLWMGTDWRPHGERYLDYFLRLFEGMVYLSAWAYLLVQSGRQKFASPERTVVFSFLLSNIILFSIIHFESRFSMCLRLFGLIGASSFLVRSTGQNVNCSHKGN